MVTCQLPITKNRNTRKGQAVGRDIIQVEANLLCFPFFALAKKDRAQRQAIEVFGTKTRDDGTKQRFSLRVSRNIDYPYPGLLSRKVHFGFLDMLADPARPRPLQNPITWTWRDLHARIGIKYAGRDSISRMKDAIHATAAAYIRTNAGLNVKRGGSKASLPDRETGYHLYDKVVFTNDILPDGTVCANNAVWISDWYLTNLNELYSGPVNYELWKKLEAAQQIASRLYEFLLFKCCGDIPFLRINYPYLASFLPVRAESSLSKAKEQLNPAFQTLGKFQVVSRIEWTTSRSGQTQLLMYPGPALKRGFGAASKNAVPRDVLDFTDLHVLEILHNHTKEHQLVCRYHAIRFGKSRHTPLQSELTFAREKLAIYSEDLLNRLLPKIAQAMEKEFPKGKYFSAATQYIDDLIREHLKAEAARKQREQEQRQTDAEDRRAEKASEMRRKRQEHLSAYFAELPAAQQQKLWQQAINAAASDFDRKQIQNARETGKLHFVLLDILDQHQKQSAAA